MIPNYFLIVIRPILSKSSIVDDLILRIDPLTQK